MLPASLAGVRALDVGTFDGFWAFEMEKRGAEVVATDVPRLDAAEWPPANRARLEQAAVDLNVELGRGFRIAAEALGSAVRRVEVTVYDLDPEAVGGPVAFAFVGASVFSSCTISRNSDGETCAPGRSGSVIRRARRFFSGGATSTGAPAVATA